MCISELLKMRGSLLKSLSGFRSSTTQIGVRHWANAASPEAVEQSHEPVDEEFRVLNILKKPEPRKSFKREKVPVPPPRYKRMSPTADWPSIWPVARTFHPASVPLPVHQGFVQANRPVPGKFANLELMKIPNFLHLTPPAIQRHCEALKRFCTAWPEGLKQEKEIDTHFPVSITSTDYCHSSPTIRDKRSRIVTVKFPLSILELDEHARDKFMRLVGDRYDAATDLVTVVTDCCPLRQQNLDYAMYLITALYHESWNVEDWEEFKEEDDMEKYIWEGSVSQKTVKQLLSSFIEAQDEKKPDYSKNLPAKALESLAEIPQVGNYARGTSDLLNKGETNETMEQYSKGVRALLNLPQRT